MAQEGNLFSGLKKLLFKDADDDTQPPAPATQPAPANAQQSVAQQPTVSSGSADASTREKAYQMLERINQPGVDFMEIWNAAEESGGVSQVKAVFNALKYADKSLTKEKVVSTGRHYITALQDALAADLQKKAAQRRQLEDEKSAQRKTLSDTIGDMERQIAALQEKLSAQRATLAELDAQYEPKLRDLQARTEGGKTAIEELLQQMSAVLSAAERDL